jgi:ankyrin repeat protein
LESPNRLGCTALHRASSLNRPPIVSFLLSKGAKVDAVNGIFNTPLHIAAYGGFAEVGELLLEHSRMKGGNNEVIRLVERMNGSGMTPFDYARKRNMRELLEPYRRGKVGGGGGVPGGVGIGVGGGIGLGGASGRRTASNSEKKLDGLMGHSFSSTVEDDENETEQQAQQAAAIQAAITSASASASRKKLVGLNLSGVSGGGAVAPGGSGPGSERGENQKVSSPKALDVSSKPKGGSSSRRKTSDKATREKEKEMKDVPLE